MTEQTHATSLCADEMPVDPLTRALDARQTIAGMIFAAMAAPRKLAAPAKSLPLTVIGGFLGAGKTTLLNHILSDPQGRKLVVLVNDFGKINIDAALIEDQTDDAINLTNGCACCAVSADLSKALAEVSQRTERPDGIVLETSGVADPAAIAQIALANQSIRLDGILTVVDAETALACAEDPATRSLFHTQLRSADLVLLSKTDLLDQPQLAEVREWLKSLHSRNSIVEAVKGRVPTDVVLGIHAPDHETMPEHDAPDHVPEGHGFESFSLEHDGLLDEKKARAFLGALPDTILRAKGFLHLADKPVGSAVFQRVGIRWSLHHDNKHKAPDTISRLVFIGPKGSLDRRALKDGFEACFT